MGRTTSKTPAKRGNVGGASKMIYVWALRYAPERKFWDGFWGGSFWAVHGRWPLPNGGRYSAKIWFKREEAERFYLGQVLKRRDVRAWRVSRVKLDINRHFYLKLRGGA